MIKGIDNTKIKNIIESDVELLQGAYFGGTPEHISEENKKKKTKNISISK